MLHLFKKFLPGHLCLVFALIYCPWVSAQDAPVAPSWLDFVDAVESNSQPLLPDFSYSGYEFSEEELPDVTDWTFFNVTDYGALPNDEAYDDEGIQAAIDAAESSSGAAVVFFPPGRFKVSSDNDIEKSITINRSNIVLKGSGSGAGGTEIFMDNMRVKNGHWQFVFRPDRINTQTFTTITGSAKRNDHKVTVANSDRLSVGQSVIISHTSFAFASAHYGDLALSPRWTRMFEDGGGMSIYEPHRIKEISGNEVTFTNPIQTDLPEVEGGYNLRNLGSIEEVGVEDILFVGNWPSVGETFVHHLNDIHDYAWNALQFKHVENAWMRDCEFKDWSQVMDIRESMAVTIQNIVISGKPAHASFITRRSYGLLIKDCEDKTGYFGGGAPVAPIHHGPGVGFSGVSTVYLRYKMSPGQRIDAHSGSPYASLYDDVDGGHMLNNGGPERLYPNHGRHLVMWNHRHDNDGQSIDYNFWSLDRRRNNTYAEPYFVGFQPNAPVSFTGAGLDELRGREVFPKSLFEAQLQLRLERTVSAESELPTDYQEIKISPNPVINTFRLEASARIQKVEVININGRLMQSISRTQLSPNELTINLTSAPPGVYLVRIKTEKGITSKKITKQ